MANSSSSRGVLPVKKSRTTCGRQAYGKQTPVPGCLGHPRQGLVCIAWPCCGWKAESALQHLMGKSGVSELQKRGEAGRGISSAGWGVGLQIFSNKPRCKGLHMHVFHYPNRAQSPPVTVSCLLSPSLRRFLQNLVRKPLMRKSFCPSGHGGCVNWAD